MIYHFFGKTIFHKMNKKGMQFAPNFKYWHFGYFKTLQVANFQTMATKKNSMRIVQWPFGGQGKIQKLSYFEGKSHMLPYSWNEFLLIAITK